LKVLDNIQQSLRFPAELVALEVCYTAAEVQYNAVHLKRVKDEVQLMQNAFGKDLSRVLSHFSEVLPVLIILTGRRVLIKELRNAAPDTEEEVLMSRAFPNISLDDLVYDIRFLEDKAVVAVVRQDFLDQVLGEITTADRRIIDVAIGTYSIWPLLEQLRGNDLHLGFHRIDKEQQMVQAEAECNEEDILAMGENLPAHLTIPFLFGLNSMASRSFVSQQYKVVRYRKDWQFHNLYKKGMFSGMVAVFALLLVSFLMFNYYHDANQVLGENMQSYDAQLKMVEELKASYERKNRFLETNGVGASSFSVMADQVAGTVPKGIALEQMSFFPLEKRLKKEKLVRFHRDQLILKGEVDNYGYFQQWLKEMNEFEWTRDIQIAGYQEENDRHEAHFNLKVLLQP
tara:strand:+ start:12368 stop:13567 length:1200 start_codon:yes stop_codon:yes gene_type:complete